MASITFWNRVEPRPRAPSIAATLAARVRDPLWMLTRQWQFGEFHGEDAGSPAFTRLTLRESRMTGWRRAAGAVHPIAATSPMEAPLLRESFPADVSLSVELGQAAEELLAERTLGGAVPTLRTQYPIPRPLDAELAAMPDAATAGLLRVCGGRSIDGVALYRELVRVAPAQPAGLPSDPNVPDFLSAFRTHVESTFGPLAAADADPEAWQAERLEYGLEVVGNAPGGGALVLAADPGGDGDFDWDAFDVRSEGERPPEAQESVRSLCVIPTNVRFRGMPQARWWDFESGQLDFGDIKIEKRDLARLVLVDFMLVHGNDWFSLPVELSVGSMCRVDSLVVHDVFGRTIAVGRADAAVGPEGERWTMFSTSREAGGVADFFLLPQSGADTLQSGAAVEDVRFIRDEMANMAWGIEHAVANGLGQGWEAVQGEERRPVTPPGAAAAGPPLGYTIQTYVPRNWFPLLPVAIDPARGDIALELGAMLRPRPPDPPEPVRPRGRVLAPQAIGSNPYRIREEEVPRAGARVLRLPMRARWTDGSTHLWLARRKQVGRGEGSSGLRFDVAEKTTR